MSADPGFHTAAADALAWLQLFRRRRGLSVNQLNQVEQQRIEVCVSTLERQLEPHLPARFAGEEVESV